jgi:CO/xanthine dehydrogenase FAD-binding subunit
MIRGYHRPSKLEEALQLLSRSEVATVPLGGGTVLNGLPAVTADEVVDLQGLGLAEITQSGADLSCGATTTLQALIDHPVTPMLVRDLAAREAPRTIRNVATLGGTIAGGDAESVLLAGLLAYGATVTVTHMEGSRSLALADLLGDRSVLAGGLITAVSWDVTGTGASASTARTPADTPIVLVAGRRSDDGTVALAATGAAQTPVLIDLDRVADLDPPGDFRGTPEYRRHLVATLGARVLESLDAGGAA